MARFDQIQFGDKALTQWNFVIVGPVCVDKASRGTGVFEGLYANLWQLLPASYEVAVALVSTTNPRSLTAHKKLAMIEVDQFVYNDKTYNTIARIIGQQKS
jgi:predicted GNAT superfamily acetyltransferase